MTLHKLNAADRSDTTHVDGVGPVTLTNAPTTQIKQAMQPDRETLHTWLLNTLASYLDRAASEIDTQEPFANFGLESIDAVSISGDLEEWLGRELPPTLLYEYPNIERLTHYLLSDKATSTTRAQASQQRDTVTEPLAIIGMSCRFPGDANTPEEFWQLLIDGREAISEVPAGRWDKEAYYDPDRQSPGKMYTRRGGFLSDLSGFDAPFFSISPREALRMDPQQRLLVELAWEALEQSGQRINDLNGIQAGVFIGMMNTDDYRQLQIQSDATVFDDPYFGMGSAASVAAGRLAYLFNLHGPAMTVDTACSSSLVATHLACQSLRNNECDLALVGGVNAITTPETMVHACKMGMLAVDGHCKSFDAAADGFVLGEGCGIIVLKRLSDALTDGNTILATIRGTAVNQDGHSNGLTAPNKLAQQAVISKALANADVLPQSISYVETHGSGTALGDPIEIEALVAALGEERIAGQHITIGTVKTNIGHLAGAAGIAGLIKTVLALQHHTIPPHINVQHLNPYIAWERLPVTLPTGPTPWLREAEPRRAGVSSFGWSGTNAHIILEEAPVSVSAADKKPCHLVLLSAKTEQALEHASNRMLTYLKKHPNEVLADIACTSQIGRNALDYRRLLLCHDKTEAIEILETRNPERLRTSVQKDETTPITFMFPGLGDQHVHMARQLYDHEQVFRDCVDYCTEQLVPLLGQDLRSILYPEGDKQSISPAKKERLAVSVQGSPDLRKLLTRSTTQDEYAQILNQTAIAQPALFVIEYALAQLWRSWGIHPQSLIGYSLGEYIAACIAEVLTLEDALKLVSLRAKLIQQLPAGAMLAVMLSEQEVQPYLTDERSLAAVNGPMLCVVAGPIPAIETLQRDLVTQGIACRTIQTTHAFHSSMMKPIEEDFMALLRTIRLNPPRIPYVSSVTGRWITARQAMDPTYWVQHLRQPVRFADGLETITSKARGILLEIGPGQALSNLALQYTKSQAEMNIPVIASAGYSYDATLDTPHLLRALGEFWLLGAKVNWAALHDAGRRLLPLPTYAFEHQSYWVAHNTPLQPVQQGTTRKQKLPLSEWFSLPSWQQSQSLSTSVLRRLKDQKQCWLIFADAHGLGLSLAQRLEHLEQDVTLVVAGENFRRERDGVYSINPHLRDDYDALLNHLHLTRKLPQQLLHLWNVTEVQTDLTLHDRAANISQGIQSGFESLLFLAQALGGLRAGNPQMHISVFSNQMHDVIGGDCLHPEKALLLGPCKVIPKEYAHISCRSIDLVLPKTGTKQAEDLIEQLVREIATQTRESVIAYRNQHRWVQTFEPVTLEESTTDTLPLRKQGVYLITGGLGGIGLATASYLAGTMQAKLVLISRSGLPAREEWTSWVASHEESESISKKIRMVLTLEEQGAEVLVMQADVCNPEAMRNVVAATHTHFGSIHGVIHAAGVPGDGLIQLKELDMARRVLAPKVQGTLVLLEALRAESLDFLALYSSSNAITGGLGEVDYCAANAFLDAFAHMLRSDQQVPVVSINWSAWQWDAWQSTLFATQPELAASIKQIREKYGITFHDGMQALLRVLGSDLPQVLVLPQGIQATIEQSIELSSLSFLDTTTTPKQAKPHYARPALRTAYVAPRTEAERKIATIWQEALGIDKVGMQDHFFELGGNSLIGMVVISRLQKEFNVQLSAASLFEGPTISSLLALIQPEEQEIPVLQQNSSRGSLRRERLMRHKKDKDTYLQV